MSPGITYLPVRSWTAPPGAFISAAGPTQVIRPSVTIIPALRRGSPLPIRVKPLKAVTSAPAVVPRSSANRRVFIARNESTGYGSLCPHKYRAYWVSSPASELRAELEGDHALSRCLGRDALTPVR